MKTHLKIGNYIAVRVIFCAAALPLCSFAWQTGTSSTSPCLAVGQLSGWDPLDHTVTLRTDSGDYSDFAYDDSTTFNDGETTVPPDNLNIDDRLCVTAFRTHGKAIASRVLATRRSQIEARDRQDLVHWQQESVFGTVASLDTDNHRIELRTPGGSDVSIDIAEPIAFWVLPAQADDPAEAVTGNWRKAGIGDDLYVRGERQPGTAAIRARLIVAGGFRTFVGTVDAMDPLTETVQLRDFRSGRVRSIHFDFMPIYVAARGATPDHHHLYGATVGDLKEGDSVLILADQDVQTSRIRAFVLITGFSREGILGPATGQSSDWIFKALGIGGRATARP